jgi:hypothetical protein
MKRITIFILIIASALLLSVICWYLYTPNPQKLPVSIVTHQYIYDISNKYETMGMSDYVFVGTVEKMEGYSYTKSENCPYTLYSILVDQNLKGELPIGDSVIIQKIGGMDKSKQYMVIEEDDIFFLEEGKRYIFAACVNKEGILNIPSPNRVIEFENEDVLQEYEEAIENETQNEIVQKTWDARNHVYGKKME